MRRKAQGFVRKAEGSQNAVKAIPNLAHLLFGLQEDLKRFRLPVHAFEVEKGTINRSVIAALKERLAKLYNGYGAPQGRISRGEALLNCYLDVFITFTVLKTPKEIGAKPSFLVYPITGSVLELDVLFEDFRLAFEFQGHPSHYTDRKTQAKDAFKLVEVPAHSRILIPVNVCQLNSGTLLSLIANSMKDHVGVHEALANKNPSRFAPRTASPRQLLRFSKAVQRLYLADSVFRGALTWVDGEARKYVAMPMHRGSTSATTAAPRQASANPDLDLAYVYENLRYVTAIRKKR